MKSIFPDPEQLDRLAAGLDAGWDAEPVPSTQNGSEAPPAASEPAHSTPLPAGLEALDANSDSPVAASSQARSTPRPSAVRPSLAHPNPTLAATATQLSRAVPLLATKQERRDAERKRRVHQAQQKVERKKERKAERQAEARRAIEQSSAAEPEALSKRRSGRASARKRLKHAAEQKFEQQSPVRSTPASTGTRREQPAKATPRRVIATRTPKSDRPPVVVERGAKKLLIPLILAIVFALTFYFALSRSR